MRYKAVTPQGSPRPRPLPRWSASPPASGWVGDGQAVLVTGATGSGSPIWHAHSANQACRARRLVLLLPRLPVPRPTRLAASRAENRHPLRRLTRGDLALHLARPVHFRLHSLRAGRLLRFIHISDVHLDTAFACRSSCIRDRLRNALREAFARCLDTAVSERVDAVLIAGDLFDDTYVSLETERFLLEQFQTLAETGIQVIYATGTTILAESYRRLPRGGPKR